MWKNHKTLILAAVLLTATAANSFAQEAELLAVLRSDATLQEKSAACRQLARIATSESIPTLASLLGDERLSHMARYAMEPIADPAVDDALRDALDKVQGKPRLGIIGSLGARRDVKAVDPLARLLSEPETVEAAARALGNIGTLPAAKALEAVLPKVTNGSQKAVCEGLFRCAETLSAAGETDASKAIYDSVRALKDAPLQIRAAALRGAILSRGKDGVPLLVEAITGPDYGLAAAAARAAMELPGTEVADALLAELPNASPERQSLLIMALAVRGEPQVLPEALKAAQNGDGQLRILAFNALKRVGDASCVPALLDAAINGDDEVSRAAIESLESLQGESVDTQLATELSKAEGKERLMLIDLVGRRRTAAAAQTLWKAADDSDPAVRVAALASLGSVATTADLPMLIARLSGTKSDQEAAALDKAICDLCLRSEDREAAAAKLAAAMSIGDEALKIRILEMLTSIGGKTALETVADAAQSGDDELCDAATRLLGSWKSTDAAPVLIELHKAIDNDRYKIRVMRAYIRIARQFDMPADQRAAMCRTALEVAERDADKQLVLEVLLRYPSEEMQSIALDAAKIPALKEQALLVVMGMASKGINRAELGRALAQAGQTPVKLEIVKAEYGAEDKIKDVTDVLRKYVKGYRIIFLPNSNYNENFGDPASGTQKKLNIKYRIDGKDGEVTLSENSMIVLPMPK